MIRLLARMLSGGERRRAPLVLHQLHYDLLSSLRNTRARFFTFVYPVVLLVVFDGIFGHGRTLVDGVRVPLSHYFLAGILALSIITAAYAGLAVSVSAARERGILKRRRGTPAPAALLIAGQALTALVTAVIMAVLLLVLARAIYGISLPVGSLVAIGVCLIVGTITFACLGYAVAGLIGSADAAQPVVQATTLPLYFISGVWIPAQQLGHALNTIAKIFPIEHLAAALHQATVHPSLRAALAPADLGVMALWAVAGLLVASRRFSWLPSTAAA